MKHTVIYVPGIGDNELGLQRFVLKFWRLGGVKVIFHPMPWKSQETYQTKLARLLELIDQAGHRVILMGSSAGASAALNAFVERKNKVSKVVYICGKLHDRFNFQSPTYAENPGFQGSIESLKQNIPKFTPADKAKMLAFYSRSDKTVPNQDSHLASVQEVKLPRLRHAPAIFYSLIFKAPGIIKFIKS